MVSIEVPIHKYFSEHQSYNPVVVTFQSQWFASFVTLSHEEGIINSSEVYMGDCQNYGPFLGPFNTAPII